MNLFRNAGVFTREQIEEYQDCTFFTKKDIMRSIETLVISGWLAGLTKKLTPTLVALRIRSCALKRANNFEAENIDEPLLLHGTPGMPMPPEGIIQVASKLSDVINLAVNTLKSSKLTLFMKT
ncbi:hypothetical protein D918_01114 [Trichuris suis]|nr:hypothetical protein D918_01114 [Trichuris suis]